MFIPVISVSALLPLSDYSKPNSPEAMSVCSPSWIKAQADSESIILPTRTKPCQKISISWSSLRPHHHVEMQPFLQICTNHQFWQSVGQLVQVATALTAWGSTKDSWMPEPVSIVENSSDSSSSLQVLTISIPKSPPVAASTSGPLSVLVAKATCLHFMLAKICASRYQYGLRCEAEQVWELLRDSHCEWCSGLRLTCLVRILFEKKSKGWCSSSPRKLMKANHTFFSKPSMCSSH